jgi:hypothetical protein
MPLPSSAVVAEPELGSTTTKKGTAREAAHYFVQVPSRPEPPEVSASACLLVILPGSGRLNAVLKEVCGSESPLVVARFPIGPGGCVDAVGWKVPRQV